MSRPSAAALIWQQTRYQNKIFWRTPISAFFTLAFPLLLLVVFGALFGSEEIDYLGITVAQYFAPALAVFAAASAGYTNIAIGTAYQRDEGILKRVHGSPLPGWIYMAGKVCSGVYTGAIAVIIMMTAGVVIYGVQIYPRTLLAAILTFLVGVACFASLGLLVAAVAPNGGAATAIANATLLPLAFFSGLFILTENPPGWVDAIGDFFPLKHFNEAFQAAFNPEATGMQFDWAALGYMALWGVVAIVLAVRFFKWEARPSAGRKRRSRRSETASA